MKMNNNEFKRAIVRSGLNEQDMLEFVRLAFRTTNALRTKDELFYALEQVLGLCRHYALQLNEIDGQARARYQDAEEWFNRKNEPIRKYAGVSFTASEVDGPCLKCRGKGCKACDASFCHPILVEDLSQEPTTLRAPGEGEQCGIYYQHFCERQKGHSGKHVHSLTVEEQQPNTDIEGPPNQLLEGGDVELYHQQPESEKVNDGKK